MDCKCACRLLTAHLDGELEDHVERELRAHLEECGSCAARRAEERRIRKVIRAGAPALGACPPALSTARLLLKSRVAGAEEVALVRSLQRVAAAAVILLGATFWAVSQVGLEPGRGGDWSILAVTDAQSSAESLLDDDNSILIALDTR